MTRKRRRYLTGAIAHAKARAIERYDSELTRSDLEQIGAKIRRNEIVEQLKPSTVTRREVVVEHRGKMYRVIYSKVIKMPVTLLPWIEKEVKDE